MRILMLGNSFTTANHMPDMLDELTGAEIVQHTRGGARLAEQLNPKTKMGKRTQEALQNEKWDFVILQEMSNGPITSEASFLENAEKLCEKIRENGAKPVFYATWAYQRGGKKLETFGMDYDEMYQKLRANYYKEAQKYGLDLIPCGDVIQTLRKEKEFNVREGGISLCRDGFHMNYLYGRYALACTWLAKIFGEEAGKISNEFLAESADMQDFALLGKIRKIAEQVCWDK